MYFDLHRHDEFSLFDGFGKPIQLAKIAQEKGHTALSVSNHGTSSGLAEHYFACKEVGIKPILGVEVYFLPKFRKENKSKLRYHLNLFVKDLEGYKNLNKLMTEANLNQKYYYPIIDFKLLQKYNKGLICTTACIGSPISQLIVKGKNEEAEKALLSFKKIFREDLYVEIMPYGLSEVGLQEKVNVELEKLAEKNNIKCVLTSDSHFGNKEDFDSYLKMHEMKSIGKKTGSYDIEATYGERYMPTEEDIQSRFLSMHLRGKYRIKDVERKSIRMLDNLQEINDKCEEDILGQLPLELPSLHGEESKQAFIREIKEGLKAKGKYNKKYLKRCKREAKVIEHLGFIDYFLIVQDYVRWAKNHGIKVGPGRGSVCNCLVAYALDITDVDSIYFDLDFDRFMRMDKKKVPDIDLDFETERRQEVIDYLIKRYDGYSAQVISYGLYKTDNTINDLAKVCGIENRADINAIKKFIKANTVEDNFEYDDVKDKQECKMWNRQYQDIIKHFAKLFKKIKYYGTHAAGVVISGRDLTDYVPLEMRDGKLITTYDLGNLELINVVKFDILGLRTMSVLKELEEITEKPFEYSMCEDAKVLEEFGSGNTDGIFQFESQGSQNILREIKASSAEDVLAGSALNRPGPLSLGMHTQYGHNKENLDDVKKSPWFEYAKETYGTIVYQEQIVRICRKIGRYEWPEVDRILKVLKGRGRAIKFRDREIEQLRKIFYAGAKAGGYSKAEAEKIFSTLLIYSFNKGHAAGYGLVSIQQMFYKVYYPEAFWYVTLKYAKETDRFRFEAQLAKDGSIILLPHVNFGAKYKMVKYEGNRLLASGTSTIKNVGVKASEMIEEEREKNGPYRSLDNFLERVNKSTVNKRVQEALLEAGALEFNKKVYNKRVVKYNSTLYMKGVSYAKN